MLKRSKKSKFRKWIIFRISWKKMKLLLLVIWFHFHLLISFEHLKILFIHRFTTWEHMLDQFALRSCCPEPTSRCIHHFPNMYWMKKIITIINWKFHQIHIMLTSTNSWPTNRVLHSLFRIQQPKQLEKRNFLELFNNWIFKSSHHDQVVPFYFRMLARRKLH